MASSASHKIMIITSNLGSYFEEPTIRENWLKSFDELIGLSQPVMIALHCQEMGGKMFLHSDAMRIVDEFIHDLLGMPTLMSYNKSRCYIDKMVKEGEFTALGSFYFIHQSVEEANVWDFKARKYVKICEHEAVTDGLHSDSTHIKEKFPPGFFPEVRWTRKGFMFLRWRLEGRVINFVNIHLFHDDDNLIALDKSHSKYGEHRRNALHHSLDRVSVYVNGTEPLFIFGDFNFRLEFSDVVKHIVGDLQVQELDKEDGRQIVFRSSIGDEGPILTVMRKSFILTQDDPFTKKYMELRKFDKEPDHFKELYELDVNFQPSYPFSENLKEGRKYMPKRCPAWCDRILMNEVALKLVEESPVEPEYNLVAQDICVGDHKPVYLLFDLAD